jgi:Methyltransferase domain
VVSADVRAAAAAWRRRSKQLRHEIANGAGTTAALSSALAVGLARRNGVTGAALMATGTAAGVLGWWYRTSLHRIERQVRSSEDAAILGAALGTAAPLFGRWAAEGDFAGMIARELDGAQGLVVECGSGSTTLVIAERLRRAGSGRLVSLEHDTLYAAATGRLLASAGLDDVARVIEAPLRSQQLEDRRVEWYDRSIVETEIDGEIDMLVVDGPPQMSAWSRWGALPVLYPFLARNFVALLDDGRTRETSLVVHAWIDQFPDLDLYWLDTVKGTWLLKRRESSGMSGGLLRVARRINPRPAGAGRWPVHR